MWYAIVALSLNRASLDSPKPCRIWQPVGPQLKEMAKSMARAVGQTLRRLGSWTSSGRR